VNAIAPGIWLRTTQRLLRNDPVRSRQILERIPAARWGGRWHRSAAIFLMLSASDYVHGNMFCRDGGWLAR